jgi:division protein CdvB (Snf7/Vps24/ESCRT-III family)
MGVFMTDRTKQLIVRVTGDELAEIDRLRGSMQRATYMRMKSLGELHTVPELNRQAYGELGRVGANLNQLMHVINSRIAVQAVSDEQKVGISEIIDEVGNALAEVQNLRKILLGLKVG